MQMQRVLGAVPAAPAFQSTDADSGVLDRLTIPPAPGATWGGGQAGVQPVTADPVAVPTPTAGEFGMVVALGVVGFRVSRRLGRRS